MGIDNGLTVSKAAIFDLDGREIAVEGHKTETSYPASGLGRTRHGSAVADHGRRHPRGASRRRASSPREIVAIGNSAHGNGIYLLD